MGERAKDLGGHSALLERPKKSRLKGQNTITKKLEAGADDAPSMRWKGTSSLSRALSKIADYVGR